ncbi:MAG TPA: apolipoprotein N-acyltransferase [Terriglobales bacterium]|nr:apolipoprotein N-acyltransferase [Terriglobales bacterium]
MRKIQWSAWRLVLLSAGLQILIFPLPGLYWLSWLAVAPLLIALRRAQTPDAIQVDASIRLEPASPWQAFVMSYACGILWYLGTCYWVFDTMRHYGGLAIPVALLVLLVACLYMGLYHGLFGLLLSLAAGRSAVHRRALVLAPLLWVAVELARTRISAFPWELLGYTQTDNPALARIATLTGVYGLSFEILLVNSVFAAAFLVPRARRNWLLAAAFGAAIVLQAGRLLSPPPVPPDHTALLVQQNIPAEGTWTTDYFQGTLRDLTWISLHPPGGKEGQHFDLIVWPESPSPFFLNGASFRGVVADLARQSQTWLLVGSIGESASMSPTHEIEEFNSAGLISPAGELTSRYDKTHLVPFGEYVPFKKFIPFMNMLTDQIGNFAWGHSRAPLDAGGQKLGVFICYESIFPDEVREYVQRGADILINLTNDGWYGDSGAWKQHLQMTQMRAIENGRWLLVGTNTGVTASVDPFGRVVASTGRKFRTALPAPYGLLSSTTFYTQHGDWFAYLCAIISVGAIAARFLFRKRFS